MSDSCEIRVHLADKASAVRDQVAGAGARNHPCPHRRRGARHFGRARRVEEGDTETAPYGLGTYASRLVGISRVTNCDRAPPLSFRDPCIRWSFVNRLQNLPGISVEDFENPLGVGAIGVSEDVHR